MPVGTTAILGLGLDLKMGNGSSPQTFTTLAQVYDVSGLGQENPLVKTTHYQSVAEEYIGGIADGKQFTATCNYLPNNATQLAAVAAVVAKTAKDFRVYLPSPYNGSYYYFSALILGYTPTFPIGDRSIMEFTFKISGAFSYIGV